LKEISSNFKKIFPLILIFQTKITLVKKNLFDVLQGHYLAYCINEDFLLGEGIAVEFNNRYNMRKILQTKFGTNGGYVGKALKIDNAYNLLQSRNALKNQLINHNKRHWKIWLCKLEMKILKIWLSQKLELD